MPPMPPITQALLLINVAVFCVDLFLNGLLSYFGSLHSLGWGFMPWQVVTYAFLHGGIWHILSNMLFGLLLAFGMTFPNRTIMPLFPPIPMKAKTFVAVYGGLELLLGVTGTQQGVAHFAHLGGMLGGYLMIRYWRGQSPFGKRRR